MIDYPDLPNFLRIPQAERDSAWKGRKLTKITIMAPPPKDEDPATRKLRKEIEAQEKAKREERFARLRELRNRK